jgi:aldose 1-epimerase
MRVLSYGGIIQSLVTPDRDGGLASIVLGFDTLDAYLADTRYIGAVIGRYANRIAGARFTLDGRVHRLPANDGTSHLHGGPRGFHTVPWRAEPFRAADGVGVRLSHASPAGDAGYPGTLDVTVVYTLTESGALVIDYDATTDAPTPVNLTQHSYINLAGDGRSILDHELTLAASRYTPVDAALIPTGELAPVHGTPFDFTRPRAIGARIDAGDPQLVLGRGYDHNLVLDRPANGDLAFAARLHEPTTGRTLEIHTTEPGLQLYSGNALGGAHPARTGVALETQHFPDSPNQPAFPSTILRPGERYRSRTEYRFSATRH